MLKTLWVMRHGLAEAQFESDFTRPLSAVGEKEAISVANQIKLDGDVQPLNMLVSPFARTQSTAKIVHSVLSMEQKIQIEEMLVHFGDHQVLGEYLMSCNFQHLLLVSHMPIVAYLCRYLCLDFKINGFATAQAVRLDFDSNKSTLSTEIKHTKTYLPK